MSTRFRPLLSYANITATLALVVALSGGAYAAAKAPKNSVDSAAIKSKAVKSADLAPNAVNGKKVKDGSLKAADLAAGTLPKVDGAPGVASLRTLGTGANQAAAGNDSRLSDDRTPLDGSVSAGKFDELPYGKMRQVATCQSFTAGTFQPVRFDNLQFANGVTFDDGTDQLVVPADGTYLITAEANWAQNTEGTRGFEVYAASSEVGFDGRQAAHAVNTGQNLTALVRLNAGDAINASAGHTSSAPLSFVGPFGRCASIAVQWVGP